jgi:hypothetical protein
MPAFGILMLIVAHAADYATFVLMVAQNGIGSELNPIVTKIAEEHGLALLTVAKFATVLLVATTFLIIMRSRPKVAGSVLGIGILVGSLGAYSNIISI